MKYKFEKNIRIIFIFLFVFNLIFNLFLLINQLYQIDNIIYTVIKFLFLFIVGYIFYKDSFSKKYKKYFNIGCIICMILIPVQGINIYKENRVIVIGEFDCNDTKIYYNDYKYYSSCDFSDMTIKIGSENYSFYEVFNIRRDKIDCVIRKLGLEKEKETKKINVETSDINKSVFVKTLLETNYYYYGIEKIELLYNGEKYNLTDVDYPFNVENFLTLKKIDKHYNALYEGEYYNMIGCFRSYRELIDGYIIPTSMKVSDINSFCNDRKTEVSSND